MTLSITSIRQLISTAVCGIYFSLRFDLNRFSIKSAIAGYRLQRRTIQFRFYFDCDVLCSALNYHLTALQVESNAHILIVSLTPLPHARVCFPIGDLYQEDESNRVN